MAPTLFRPIFSNFLSLLFLLLHLGCFVFSPSSSSSQNQSSKKRKHSSNLNSSPPPPSTRLKSSTTNAISSSWSYIKRIFSSNKQKIINTQTHNNPSIQSPCSSTRSLQKPISSDDLINRSEITSDQSFFPLRNDIYPCTLCGEVFQSPIHLEQHQSIKHAISELTDEDSGNNIVRIIFQTGWVDKEKNPVINRILKIHNSKRILSRFEEYRECVKVKASRNAAVKRDERCIADGNEVLRFHCTTFICELGQNGDSSLCTQQYCSVCGIIKSGFSHKMDGISMQPSSWRGHVSVPEGIEEEFGFMNVKRAMLVCRVIAGRVGCDPGYVDKEDSGFDSLVGRENGSQMRLDEEDELLVFNSRAVLPCFVIVYTV
ncbi:uncharacterized protein LOC107023861 [Solanum pennellii]|uniref:Uncharacterized protein LOC107023861 n=1 Tax=Solanum pennellii TaxID=28526 RepID=A0ABM1H4B3_SOLPN|nr:uncharacterized protein LOC107023861 [Solanum pennellii]